MPRRIVRRAYRKRRAPSTMRGRGAYSYKRRATRRLRGRGAYKSYRRTYARRIVPRPYRLSR